MSANCDLLSEGVIEGWSRKRARCSFLSIHDMKELPAPHLQQVKVASKQAASSAYRFVNDIVPSAYDIYLVLSTDVGEKHIVGA